MSNNSYKLIKLYPKCNHEIGTIIPKGGMGWMGIYPDLENGLYHEFWEKIIEKEQFEVLSTTGITVALKVPYEFKLETKYIHQITSIKRLTDNTIFSIGDKIKMIGHANDKAPESITEIVFNKEGIPCLFTNTFHNNGINIMKAIKCEKLFTTEDGVEVFKEGNFFIVDTDYNQEGACYFAWSIEKLFIKNKSDLPASSCVKIFSTQKAAINYIDLNKPQYSLKDIINSCHTCGYSRIIGNVTYRLKLK